MYRFRFSIRLLLLLIAAAAVLCSFYRGYRIPVVDGRPVTADLYDTPNTKQDIQAFVRESPHPIERVTLNGNLLNDESIKGLADFRHVKQIAIVFDQNWCGTEEPYPNLFGSNTAQTNDLKCALTDSCLDDFCRLQTLEDLRIPQTGLTDEGIRKLSRLPSLRKLSVAGSKIDGSGFRAFSANCKLEELDLSRTNLRDDDLTNLSHLTNLRVLRLQDTELTDDVLFHLSELENLEDVHLPKSLSFKAVLRFFKRLGPKPGKTAIDQALVTFGFRSGLHSEGGLFMQLDHQRQPDAMLGALEAAHRCNPSVVAIELGSGNITTVSASLLTGIPTLRELSINGVNDETLMRLEQLPRLEKLTLNRGEIHGEFAQHLRKFEQLTDLSLLYGQFQPSAFENIRRLSGLKAVHVHSWFPREQLGDAALLRIAELPQLESLTATNSKITPNVLATLTKIPSLKSLNLEGSGVGGKDLATLSALGELEDLRLDDISVEQIKGITAFPNLRRLHTQSLLTDRALQSIYKLKKLEYLYVSACDISLSEDEIKSKMPSLKGVSLLRIRPR